MGATAVGAQARRTPWSMPHLRRLFACYFAVFSGEWMLAVPLAVVLVDTTGSATWLGLLATLRFVPLVVVGPLGGVVADRYDRRQVLMAVCGARASAAVALALAVAGGAPPWVLLLVATLDATAVTPLRPAAVALLPELSPEAVLARANATLGFVIQATWVAGPILAAASVALASPAAALVLTAVVVAAGAVAAAGLPRSAHAVGLGDPPPPWVMLRDGVAAVRRCDGMPIVLITGLATYLIFGVELVVYVLVADERLGAGPEGVGWMTAAIGLGGMLGAPIAAAAAASRWSAAWLGAGAAVFGVVMALLAVVASAWVVYPLLFVEGVANVTFDVLSITLLQRLLAGVLLARGSALFDASNAGSQVAGSLLAPVLLAWFGLRSTLVMVGLVTVALCLACVPALARLDRRTRGRRQALADTVRRLGRSPVFEAAPLVVLERLAAQSAPVDVGAGTVVIRQGDDPDDVYLLVDGDVEVRRDDQGGLVVNRLGPGDVFGEIGVVRGVPRTASVVATTAVHLLRIDGETFVQAVSMAPGADDPLQRLMAGRLALSPGS